MSDNRAMTPEELSRWFPEGKEPLEVWEDIAEWFNAETHHMRPGKDKPPGWHMESADGSDCCADAWLEWAAYKRQAAILGMREQLAAVTAQLHAREAEVAALKRAMWEYRAQTGHRDMAIYETTGNTFPWPELDLADEVLTTALSSTATAAQEWEARIRGEEREAAWERYCVLDAECIEAGTSPQFEDVRSAILGGEGFDGPDGQSHKGEG